MAKIKGYWKWHEDESTGEWISGDYRWNCSFESNGQTFTAIETYYNTGVQCILYIGEGTNKFVRSFTSQGDEIVATWDTKYLVMNFGATWQDIDDELYSFITNHADSWGMSDRLITIYDNEQKVYDKGYQVGEKAGDAAGYNRGYADGEQDGYSAGELKGYNDGKTEGRAEGKAEGLKEGYDNGYQDGLVSSEAYEKGKQAEYNAFWNMIQDHGNRTDYGQAFRNWRSSTEYLRPKYKVVPTASTSAMNTFYNCEGLKKVEAEYFDFSKKARGGYQGSGWYHTFTTCGELEEIEDIGIMPDTDLTNTFAHCPNLKKIAMIRVDANTVISSGIFEGCKSLESVTFDGEIGYGMNLKWSTKLNLASMQNIVACLAELAEGVSGKTLTLSETAVNAIRGVSGADFVTPSTGTLTVEWLNIQSEAQRKGWDIVLA